MKRSIFFSLLIIFLFLIATKTTFAIFNLTPQFSGRVINTKAFEIQALEWAGYECPVPGSSISIAPIGSPRGTPTSYLIPWGTYSKTGNNLRRGQQIIGKYNWKTIVNCFLPTPPYTVTPVSLNTITLFGNSR